MQAEKGGIHGISAWCLPVLQVQCNVSFCPYYSDVLYSAFPCQSVFYLRNNCSGDNVPDPCYKTNDNFYKPEYFNILFDFIPLCAGNSACFDNSKIFYRSCLDWLGLL